MADDRTTGLATGVTASSRDEIDHLRHHRPHAHIESAFGNDVFGKVAEAFARVFGTPRFILIQTVIVGVWIVVNAVGFVHFDLYPFILLNLAFSTQAAYAAPLILLAATRQAARDKAFADADARHREELHAELKLLVKQNTELTQQVHELAQEMREHIIATGQPSQVAATA